MQLIKNVNNLRPSHPNLLPYLNYQGIYFIWSQNKYIHRYTYKITKKEHTSATKGVHS